MSAVKLALPTQTRTTIWITDNWMTCSVSQQRPCLDHIPNNSCQQDLIGRTVELFDNLFSALQNVTLSFREEHQQLFTQRRCWTHKAYLSVRAGRASDWPSGFHWAPEMKPNSDPDFLWAPWFTDRNHGSLLFLILDPCQAAVAKVRWLPLPSFTSNFMYYPLFFTTWNLFVAFQPSSSAFRTQRQP